MNRKETLAAVAAAVLLFTAVTGLVVGVTTVDAPAISRRSAAIDLPALPQASEAPEKREAAPGPSLDCPHLKNPGGLSWVPSADAGPWPTDGRVALPSLGVEAPVVKVGVGKDGSMVVPHNAREIAWLDQGEYPGRTNNVVLAGHISYSRVAGSFFRIREMQPGDIITVTMNGERFDYEVKFSCLFDRNTKLASKIMGRTEAESVTLISCGGVFDRAAGTHDKRIAVRAVRL
jgi:LPXTG-site transpeptidase (sortase) family protein